jgi:bacillopeptidase F
MRSRLKDHTKKQSVRILLGIVSIIIVLLVFGNQFLIGIGAVLEKLKGSDEPKNESKSIEYISPPVLNPIQDATNKSEIDITGYTTSSDVVILVYVNDKLSGNTEVENDNTFKVSGLKLIRGENKITAKSESPMKSRSEFSNAVTIRYLDEEPKLEIKSPSDGQIYKKDQSPIRISGVTDRNVKVTVNDFWAISEENGEFTYLYNLKDGDNSLKIVATDEAGNKAIKEITIKVE